MRIAIFFCIFILLGCFNVSFANNPALYLLLLGDEHDEQSPPNLIISEYIEGSGSNKAIEIYNTGPDTQDLSTCSLSRYNNGSLTVTDTLDLSTVMASLPSGDVLVVGNPSSGLAIQTASDVLHSLAFFNGDDAIELSCGSVTLDVIGEIGEDPGTGWIVGTGSTHDYTLCRKHCGPGTDDWTIGKTTWDVFPMDTFDGLGTVTCP